MTCWRSGGRACVSAAAPSPWGVRSSPSPGGPAPDIASIVPPTLVLWGQGDRWFASDYGETLVSRIPRSALVLIPAAGHLLIQEQPGDVADAIHAFDEREATLAQPPAAISSVMPA